MVVDSPGKSSKFRRDARSIFSLNTARTDRRQPHPAGRPARRIAQRGEGNEIMKRKRRWAALYLIGAGLGLTSGCQTWVPVPGLTLPSGHYLEHPPTYIPESGPFPLPMELAHMQEGAGGGFPGPVGPGGPGGPEGLPPPVPPIPGP
jgi:hypothetical protein